MYPNPANVLPFPPRPSLEQYKKRAKELVKACKSRERDTIRTWAAAWIESLASALKMSDGDRRAWFDQRENQIGTALGQATWCVINSDRSADYIPIIIALLDAGARVEEADYPTGNQRVDDLLHHRRG